MNNLNNHNSSGNIESENDEDLLSDEDEDNTQEEVKDIKIDRNTH